MNAPKNTKLPLTFYVTGFLKFCSEFDLDVAKYNQWFTTEYPQNSGERRGLIESAAMNDSSIWTRPYRLYIYVDNSVVFWGQNKVSFHWKENFNKRSLD